MRQDLSPITMPWTGPATGSAPLIRDPTDPLVETLAQLSRVRRIDGATIAVVSPLF